MKHGRTITLAIGSSWVSLLVAAALQLIQIPIALKLLGGREFALFAVVSQVLGFVTLFDLGMTASFSRHLIDGHVAGPSRYRQIWSAGFLILALQAAVMAVAATLLAPWIPPLFRLDAELAPLARHLFWAMGGVMALRQLLSIYGIALFAGQQLTVSNLTQTAGCAVQFGAFVWFLHAGCGLWSYVASMCLAVLTICGLQWMACRRHGLVAPLALRDLQRADVVATARFGLDAFVLMVFELVVNGLMLAFAGRVLPLEQVAVLSVNLKPIQLITQALQRIQASSDPVLATLASHGDLARFRFGWLLQTKGIVGATTGCAVGYAIWCPAIITLWTSSAMLMPSLAVFLLVMILLRNAAHRLLVNSLYLFKRIDIVRGWLVLEAAVYAVLGLTLGRRYGMAGILAAVLLSFLTGTAWIGGRQILSLAGFPGREWRGAAIRLGLFVGVHAAVLGWNLGTIWQLGVPARLAVSAVWMLLAAGWFGGGVLTPDERRHLAGVIHLSPGSPPCQATG